MNVGGAPVSRARITGSGLTVLASFLGLGGCSEETLAPPSGVSAAPSSTVLDLAPGEFVTLTGPAAVAPIDIGAIDETRAFAVAIQNASETPGTNVPLRVVLRRVNLLALDEAPGAPLGLRSTTVRRSRRETPSLDRWYGSDELRFRASVRRRLTAGAVRPLRAGRLGVRGRMAPTVGQVLRLRSPIGADGAVDACAAEQLVTGVVRVVGPHFAIVEDSAIAGNLVAADFAEFLDEAERVVVPVGEAYSGTPPDLDGNGVVIVLISKEVNRVGAAGFFTPSDFADAADCPTSNEGEILWLVAPDPVGQFGVPVDLQTVRDRSVGIIAHELQHLVHAGRRMFEGGGGFESSDAPWLNEGLSHIAEEVAGLFAAGRRTGSNLDFSDLGQPDVHQHFRRYHFGNFAAVRDYLQSTSDVPAIVDETVARADFRRARGFGYLFLRWLADQFAAEGAAGLVGTVAEEEMFRALTLGGPGLLRSTSNIEFALSSTFGVTRSWSRLFGDYAGAPVVDDLTLPEVRLDARLELATWNLPALYQNAGDNGFDASFPVGFPLTPAVLRPESLDPGGHVLETELLPSTAFYLRIESANRTPLTRLSLLDLSGRFLSSDRSIQVTIVRMF